MRNEQAVNLPLLPLMTSPPSLNQLVHPEKQRIALQVGKYSHEIKTCSSMTLHQIHRNNVLLFHSNSNGKNNVWKIRIFIPVGQVVIPKLYFKVGDLKYKKLDVRYQKGINSVEGSFQEVECFYSNPLKTGNGTSPHIITFGIGKQYHELFPMFVLSGTCSDKFYRPDFWQVLTLGSFLVHYSCLTTEKELQMYRVWCALFKCYDNENFDSYLVDLFRFQKRESLFIGTCNKILEGIELEDYSKILLNSPMFTMLYVFLSNSKQKFIPNLSGQSCQNFTSAIEQCIVGKFFPGGKNNDILKKAIDSMSKFIERGVPQKQVLENIKQHGMGMASEIASFNPNPGNIKLFEAVLELVDKIN